MRNTDQIAAEAIRANCDRINRQAINYAIEIGRIEALAEVYLRKEIKRAKVFILTGTPWNEYVRYIRAVEFSGTYYCTNTAWCEWAK